MSIWYKVIHNIMNRKYRIGSLVKIKYTKYEVSLDINYLSDNYHCSNWFLRVQIKVIIV